MPTRSAPIQWPRPPAVSAWPGCAACCIAPSISTAIPGHRGVCAVSIAGLFSQTLLAYTQLAVTTCLMQKP